VYNRPPMEKLSVTLVSTFTLALLHTLIPSHWLCFVLVGRAQGWRPAKTLGVTAAAGFVHVASSVTIGVALLAAGRTMMSQEHLLEKISALVLVGLGAVYLVSHLIHAGHHHEQDKMVSEKTAVVALLFSLVLSPCSASIPLLILESGGGAGWGAIALIAAVLLVTTLGVMLLMVGLTSLGIERLQFTVFDRYEKLIVGLVLCALGALVLLVHD
jgi:nickel/cobalt exporter